MDKNVVPNSENSDLKDSKEIYNEMAKFIFAYDPKIKKRVVHVVKGEWAISMVTGNKFKYKPTRSKRK